MYPDLTQKGTPGNTEFCGVQEDPTQPWGGQLTLKNARWPAGTGQHQLPDDSSRCSPTR